MPELTTTPTDELNAQALLYLSGELHALEAAAFEERLAGDPRCQEALIAAVSIWPGFCETQPDPQYRQRAAQRLGGLRQPRVVVVTNRQDRRRSFAWALVGGLAAAVLVTIVNPARWFGTASGPTIIVTPPAALAPSENTTEVIYSDLSNTERLGRVRLEHEQRRQKQEDMKIHHPPLSPGRPGRAADGGKSMM